MSHSHLKKYASVNIIENEMPTLYEVYFQMILSFLSTFLLLLFFWKYFPNVINNYKYTIDIAFKFGLIAK